MRYVVLFLAASLSAQTVSNQGAQIAGVANEMQTVVDVAGTKHYYGGYNTIGDGVNTQLLHVNLSTGITRLIETAHGGRTNLGRHGVLPSGNLYWSGSDPCYFYRFDPTTSSNAQKTAAGWANGACGTVATDKIVQTWAPATTTKICFGTAVRGTVFCYDENTDTITDYGVISPPAGNATCTGCYRYVYTLECTSDYCFAGMRDANTNYWWLTILRLSDGNQSDCFLANNSTNGEVGRLASDGTLVYTDQSTQYLLPTNGSCPTVTQAGATVPSWNYKGTNPRVYNVLGDIAAARSGLGIDLDTDLMVADSSTNATPTLKWRLTPGSGEWQTASHAIATAALPIKRAVVDGSDLWLSAGSYGPVGKMGGTFGTFAPQSNYSMVKAGGYFWLSGYTSSTYKFDPAVAWSVGALGNCPGTNPCKTALSLGHYHYYSTVGSNGLVYVAANLERDGGTGGRVGWVNPATLATGSVRTGLECWFPRGIVAVGSSLAIPASAITDADWSCAETQDKLFVLDTATHTLTSSNLTAAGRAVPVGGDVIVLNKGTGNYVVTRVTVATGAQVYSVTNTGSISPAYYDWYPALAGDGWIYVPVGTALHRVSPADGVAIVVPGVTLASGVNGFAADTGSTQKLYAQGPTSLYQVNLSTAPTVVTWRGSVADTVTAGYLDGSSVFHGGIPVGGASCAAGVCSVSVPQAFGDAYYRINGGPPMRARAQ